MLLSTPALVLGKVAYNDSFALAHMLTREAGYVTYRIPLGGGKRSIAERLRRALFPLNELSLVADHRPTRAIQTIKEVATRKVRLDVLNNPKKQQITLFLAELLDKLLQQGRSDNYTYDFISDYLDLLEEAEQGVENYHLLFLFRFLAPCGIAPDWQSLFADYKPSYYFSLSEVSLMPEPPRGIFLTPEDTYLFSRLVHSDSATLNTLKLSAQERMRLIDHLITFYRIHYAPIGELHTASVLASIYHS